MKSGTFFELMRAAGLALVLATMLGGLQACGGDAELGTPGDGPGGGPSDGNGDDDEVSVSRLTLLSSSPRLASSANEADEGVQLTILASDADNNAVEGAEVTFSANPNAFIVDSDGVTSENGSASAVLTTRGDQRNRTITVRASAGGAEDSLDIEVVGTELEVTGPDAIRQGGIERFDILLTDDAGNGIFDQAIQVSSEKGNDVSPRMPSTDVNGAASVEVTASVPDEDTLTFEGFGLSAEASFVVSPFQLEFLDPEEGSEQVLGDDLPVTVELSDGGNPVAGEELTFFSTRGMTTPLSAQSDGDGRVSVMLESASSDGAGPVVLTVEGPEGITRSQQFDFVSTNPDAITVQAVPAVVGGEEESVISAQVTDPDGNPVKNQTVRFSLQDTSGGELRDSRAITDTQGIARVTYVAGETGSPSEGVRITASVGQNPVIASDDVTLTVREEALFVVLGSDNLVSKESNATYAKTYNAIVTDANGSAPPQGTDVNLSIRSLEFQKGRMVYNGTVWAPVYQVPESDPFYGTPNPLDDPDSANFGPYFGGGPFGCRSEDPFGTGDQNQADNPPLSGDYNGDGDIDPPNEVVIPDSVEVNENGVAEFTIVWPQNFSQWVLVRMTASVSAQGTEGRRRLDFVLPIAAEDVEDEGVSPPNLVSPFGTSPECAEAA